MAILAPYLPYEKLREIAASFLAEHNPSGTVPVPIEHIVEFHFGIDIVPTPGLHDHFDIDSYPTSDLTEIHVDEWVYLRHEPRYRFSLAHELSHVLIHRDVFEQLTYRSIGEWKAVVQSIPEDQYSWLEWQAYCLAGLILVPGDELRVEFERLVDRAAAAGVDVKTGGEEVAQLVESHLARYFNVSRPVIAKRARREGLWG